MASVVLGIIGWFLVAIPFALVARRQIKRRDGRQSGMGLATAGIAVSCAWVLVLAVVVVLAATGSFGTTNAGRFSGARKPIARLVDDPAAAVST